MKKYKWKKCNILSIRADNELEWQDESLSSLEKRFKVILRFPRQFAKM